MFKKQKNLFLLLALLCSVQVGAYTYDISQKVIIHHFGLNLSRVNLSTAYYTVKSAPGHTIVDQTYKDSFWAAYPFWYREAFSKNSYSYFDFSGLLGAGIALIHTVGEGPRVILGTELKNFNKNFPTANKNDNNGGVDVDLIHWRYALGPKIGMSNYLKLGGQAYMGVHSANLLSNLNYVRLNDSGTLAYGLGIHYVRDMIDALGRFSMMYNWLRHHDNKELRGNQLSFEASYYCFEKMSVTAFYSVTNVKEQRDGDYLLKPSLKNNTVGFRVAYTFIPE